MQKKLILFTDIGDTIIDEGSEVRDVPGGIVKRADCIPGAAETARELHRRGFVIAMVADGYYESFHNTMTQHGLWDLFAVTAISDELGCSKPDPRMFGHAFDGLGLTQADKRRVVMIGNNLERDIAGANRFGIRSVHMAWTPRYRKTPENPDEVPTYTVQSPEELLELAERLEHELES